MHFVMIQPELPFSLEKKIAAYNEAPMEVRHPTKTFKIKIKI